MDTETFCTSALLTSLIRAEHEALPHILPRETVIRPACRQDFILVGMMGPPCSTALLRPWLAQIPLLVASRTSGHFKLMLCNMLPRQLLAQGQGHTGHFLSKNAEAALAPSLPIATSNCPVPSGMGQGAGGQ